MKKRNIVLNIIIILLILIIIVATCIGMYAWAKYTSRVEGNAEAQVAKWSFKVVDGIMETSDVIDFAFTRTDGYGKVAAGVLAPGTFGEFEIGIDARGTETALKYTIEATLNNKPANLKLYSDEEKTKEIIFTNNKFIIMDYMDVDDIKEIKTIKVYWEWPYQTGSEADDLRDTEDAGKNVEMQISVTGTQELDLIKFKIGDETFYAEKGMSWGRWIDSPDYSSTGFISDYGEGYHVIYTENYQNYVKLQGASRTPINIEELIIEGTNYELGTVNWPM